MQTFEGAGEGLFNTRRAEDNAALPHSWNFP